jgi:hypothetical protein
MMNYAEMASVPSDRPVPFTDQLRLAVAAYLARFTGSSRDRTESDLRCFLAWCAANGGPCRAWLPGRELLAAAASRAAGYLRLRLSQKRIRQSKAIDSAPLDDQKLAAIAEETSGRAFCSGAGA